IKSSRLLVAIFIPGRSLASHCADLAVCCDSSYAVVICICNEYVAEAVDGNANRPVETGCMSGSVLMAAVASSSYCTDQSVSGDPPNPVVGGIRYYDFALSCQGNSRWSIELCR